MTRIFIAKIEKRQLNNTTLITQANRTAVFLTLIYCSARSDFVPYNTLPLTEPGLPFVDQTICLKHRVDVDLQTSLIIQMKLNKKKNFTKHTETLLQRFSTLPLNNHVSIYMVKTPVSR